MLQASQAGDIGSSVDPECPEEGPVVQESGDGQECDAPPPKR